MTTSDYLKVQADLLIAARLLKDLRLEEFAAKAEEVVAEGALRDAHGLAVATNPVRMKGMARAAQAFVETVRQEVA